MQIINNFVFNQVVAFLEKELVAYEPAAQAALLAEVEALVAKAGGWVKNKVEALNAPK